MDFTKKLSYIIQANTPSFVDALWHTHLTLRFFEKRTRKRKFDAIIIGAGAAGRLLVFRVSITDNGKLRKIPAFGGGRHLPN